MIKKGWHRGKTKTKTYNSGWGESQERLPEGPSETQPWRIRSSEQGSREACQTWARSWCISKSEVCYNFISTHALPTWIINYKPISSFTLLACFISRTLKFHSLQQIFIKPRVYTVFSSFLKTSLAFSHVVFSAWTVSLFPSSPIKFQSTNEWCSQK